VARYDAWLAMQRQLVDNGAAAATIVLEAPDGTRYGTWPIGFPNLEESIAGMLQSLNEGLPKGRHSARLTSFDSQQAQLSTLPVTVVGSSEAATEAAQGRVTQERANAIFISNAEKQIEISAKVIAHAGEMLNSAMVSLAAKDELIDRLIEATKKSQIDLLEAQGRQERLGKMAERLTPMLEVGVNFAAAFASDWLENWQAKQGKQQAAGAPAVPPPAVPPGVQRDLLASGAPEQPPPQNPSHEPATVADLPGAERPTPSEQPASTHTARGDSPPRKSRAHGEGRDPGNRRGNPVRDRNKASDSEPKRRTGRRPGS
jgi:RNase P/RNase MRP subunit p29